MNRFYRRVLKNLLREMQKKTDGQSKEYINIFNSGIVFDLKRIKKSMLKIIENGIK